MTLKVRRILSLVFILLFIVITPLIVLYAAGYRISKNGLAIQRTGLFVIDSYPSGAKIFLNGQAQKKIINFLFHKNNFITTPARIKNLLPGEYELSLELDGYWGWQKKLTINPGAATFAEDIYLFKNNLPAQILSAEFKSINLSPDKNLALASSSGRLILFNLADETSQIIDQDDSTRENVAWSSDGQKLVIGHYLYNLNDLKARVDLNKILSGFNYKWQDNILYFKNQTSIYQLSGNNLPLKIFGDKKIDDFLIKNRYLYLINQPEASANSLEIIDTASGEKIKNIGLPASADYSFINPKHSLINLYDKNHQILYLIDPSTDYYSPIREIINNVKNASWIDNDNLLYANDFEIWLYNLKTKDKNLVTRVSTVIDSALIHPSQNYIIYSTSQTINAIELDERGKKNTTELAKFDLIGRPVLNAKGDILYFPGKIGRTEGLYKLLIQ